MYLSDYKTILISLRGHQGYQILLFSLLKTGLIVKCKMTLTLYFLHLKSIYQPLEGNFKCFCNLSLTNFSVTNQLRSLSRRYFSLIVICSWSFVKSHSIQFISVADTVTNHAKNSIYAANYSMDLKIVKLLDDNHLFAGSNNNLS